ncbi:MAG: CRISPR-associated endoribonuclease Cas6 [Candidatus Methanofastidiosum methylothiophilum]|jgi:CRISPR-associated endoribonuclease Cas6|uniref:CRISPR-associated endoribonuclease Cas6 n=1 Tax=Candidatus Methanofastidiosum methylothiophilum TaxID=1705564 RepID=A0A150IZZ9_9EURY|nr:MAG: CRISPR-associated endoribonuclease Cas6 [Candidatus Methanofastidiosum methylthiophilus]NMC34099.1 CRISPR-associated endoribonuclease Cas6 [Veillonellaceae bacterium]OPY25008.1 MAG: CRISPR-associated endoribonuclease Cas6 [Methanobacterium sp. PtaU1.Bin097]
MRIRVDLQGQPGLFIQFNYNHILSSIIYNKIYDLDYAAEMHMKHGFKFFTFSQFIIPKRKQIKEGFKSIDGHLHFFISSPDETLINNLIRGLNRHPDLTFQGQHLKIHKVSLVPKPYIKDKMYFKTLSPIIVRTKKNGKIWDLAPSDKLFHEGIKRNLLKKYKEFTGNKDVDGNINIDFDVDRTIRKRIKIPKPNGTTFNRAYMTSFMMEADHALLRFAYDCGVGEKNSMGFGMVMVI